MPAHFTPESMRFLRGLIKHNDRTWFEDRRSVYERSIRKPLHALIDQINAELGEFAPEYTRPAHKIAMRIYRDTRFSPDKRPYKNNLAAWWARQGLERRSAGGFYLQLGPSGGFLATAIYAPERDDLLTFRRWLAEHHVRLRNELLALHAPAGDVLAMQPVEANALTRNPKGFDPAHPASDLLRARNFGVTAPLSAEDAISPNLASIAVAHFRRTTPLISLLNEPFLPASTVKPTTLRR